MWHSQVDFNKTVNAKARLEGLVVDAVQTYRQKAAKAAAEAAAKAAEEDPTGLNPARAVLVRALLAVEFADQEP